MPRDFQLHLGPLDKQPGLLTTQLSLEPQEAFLSQRLETVPSVGNGLLLTCSQGYKVSTLWLLAVFPSLFTGSGDQPDTRERVSEDS